MVNRRVKGNDASGKTNHLPGSFSPPLRRIITGGTLFVFVCVSAIVGYLSAGWRFDDAVYMVIITIFGVGYGEVKPIETPALRALTIAVIICGYGAVIYTVGGFMQMLIDGELNRALGDRRMAKDIERLSGHTIVCGYGRLGTILARELSEAGKAFVVIDANPDRLLEAETRGHLVLHGDATEEHILEKAGLASAANVATVLSEDAINVFVTITARAMNDSVTIIARGENPRTEKKLLGCGANQVILPTAIGAQKVAQLITRPSAERILESIHDQSTMSDDLLQIGLQFNELTVNKGTELAGQKLGALEIRGNYGYLIVGVRRTDGTTDLNPGDSTVLNQGDVVIVLGHDQDLPELQRKFERKKPEMSYRGVKV